MKTAKNIEIVKGRSFIMTFDYHTISTRTTVTWMFVVCASKCDSAPCLLCSLSAHHFWMYFTSSSGNTMILMVPVLALRRPGLLNRPTGQ